jgi:hypothetical protein
VLFRHHVDTEAMCGFVAANGLRDLLTQQSCVTVSIRMEPTDQRDEKSSARRINPEQGPSVPGVTIGIGSESRVYAGGAR